MKPLICLCLCSVPARLCSARLGPVRNVVSGINPRPGAAFCGRMRKSAEMKLRSVSLRPQPDCQSKTHTHGASAQPLHNKSNTSRHHNSDSATDETIKANITQKTEVWSPIDISMWSPLKRETVNDSFKYRAALISPPLQNKPALLFLFPSASHLIWPAVSSPSAGRLLGLQPAQTAAELVTPPAGCTCYSLSSLCTSLGVCFCFRFGIFRCYKGFVEILMKNKHK